MQHAVLGSKVRLMIYLSIAANVILSALNIYATISSGSLAVLASLVDTLLDLISQVSACPCYFTCCALG